MLRRPRSATLALGALLATVTGSACAGRSRPSWTGSALARPAREGATRLAPGVVHRTLAWTGAAPWRAEVLEVDLACGATVAAHKAGGAAVGRAGTLALVREAARTRDDVAGGANADFFSFRPAGVPVTAHVGGSRVVTGPAADRPVFALDAHGRPWFGTLAVSGWATAAGRGDTLALAGWNRAAPGALALYDAAYGARTDSIGGRLFVTLGRPDPAVTPTGIPHRVPTRRAVLAVDSGAAAPLPADGAVLVLAADAPGSVRRRLAALRPGADSIALTVRLAPVVPREAVGGHPLLLHEGAPVAGADRAGDAGFIGRNPRTAVGLSRDRRHLLLVTVDGRRPGWSVGMSLAELTALLQGLGAWEALNLDGGGSTTLVVRAPDAAGGLRIANQPSDSAGERPVANALVVHACRRR
ncbi:MAG TPA: phosphodiester glycosidase family protein [Gemmatirosa sp.]|nr:phosphodiester glycosidase family protein [Gemmatirosa sp.]